MMIDNDVLTPHRIVEELDRYIVGQKKAKKAVAIALRNRIRRQRLPEDVREEIAPKNILMIGPTGVGKPKSPADWRNSVELPSLKSRLRSTPKSDTWAAMSNRWCATSWPQPSPWSRRRWRRRSERRRKIGRRTDFWTFFCRALRAPMNLSVNRRRPSSYPARAQRPRKNFARC